MATAKCVGCGKVGEHERYETPKPIRLCDDCTDIVLMSNDDGDEDEDEDEDDDGQPSFGF